jgi:hypothetical protein
MNTIEALFLKSQKNLLKGITPTQELLDTPMSDIPNSTDGSMLTQTGAGSKVLSGAGLAFKITYDIGSAKDIKFSGIMNLWVSAGTLSVYLTASTDNWNADFPQPITWGSTAKTTEQEFLSCEARLYGRYIMVYGYQSGAATVNVRLKDFNAKEVINL